MADLKISALTASTTPLAGTEVLPIVQSSTTKQVSVANLTAGRAVSATSVALNGAASALTPAFIRNGSFSCSPFGADYQMATFGAYNDDLTNGGFVLSALVSDVVTEVARGGTAGLTVTSGNVVIGTSGKGIDFSATPGTGTSELLADYEEGTFTPTVGFATPGTSAFSYAVQTGRYTKVGRLVTIEISLVFAPTGFTKGTASGQLSISGLPYAAAVPTTQYIDLAAQAADYTASTLVLAQPSSTSILFERTTISGSNVVRAYANVNASDFAVTNAGYITISVTTTYSV